MSVFEEILCKLNEISNNYVRSLNDDIKVAFECLDKFAEEYQNGRGKRDQNQKKALVNTLMSINEDADEDSPKDVQKSKDGTEKRLSNKRSKEQVEGMSSPEQDKRQKRNASVMAQNKISKQSTRPLEVLNQNILLVSDDEGGSVNVSLTQKMRRDDATEKSTRRRKEDKENTEPAILQVKLEKISLPLEPMDTEATLEIPIKQEPNKDGAAMPPPAAPVPRRGRPAKEKSTDSEDEQAGGRRTRTKKNTDNMPPPTGPPPMDRSARASRRNTKQGEAAEPPPPEPRPKRTRAKKKAAGSLNETENTQPTSESCIGSPADKPRPKRTRRGKKAAEEEETPKPKEPSPESEIIIPKQERISIADTQSPAIPQKTVKKTKADTTVTSDDSIQSKKESKKKTTKKVQGADSVEEAPVVNAMNATVTISMDKTVVLPSGVYDHTDGRNAVAMNETVVLDKGNRETMVLDKPQAKIMDSTVVLDKAAGAAQHGTPNVTDDLSLLTDDNSSTESATPDRDGKPPEPTSAVKAKVQQFEEMAARTTRTKTRAMAKKDAETESCTPPDKILSKHVLSADTLSKMNSMIFNGKTTQISSSATKPTAKLPPVKTMPASASKVSAINKAREEQLNRDDARRKKEAMLEAKKEQQRRKREEKMAAAAAARSAAERERRAALQAAAKDRMEKQAHADQGKLERMKEAERKKQELARKVAETEERRRVEEAARVARLADEQRRADAARRKQLEETEAMKKEAAMMAKEIEKRQKEYLEKQKKQKMEADKIHTPLKNGAPCGRPAMEPVYMCDGFQHLNSDDDDDEPPKVPTPAWCKSKHRQLALQHLLPPSCVDRLFSVRVHSVDLRAIFPALERAQLKRTSSAVWRTPPALQLSRVHESPV